MSAPLHPRCEPFALRWSTYDVAEKHRGVKRLVHPDAGEIRVAYEILLLPDENERRLVSWLPADDRSAAVMARLLEIAEPVSPARRRVVGSLRLTDAGPALTRN